MVDLRALCVVNPSCKGRWWKWKAMIDEVSSDKIFWNTLKRVLNWSFEYMIFYPSGREDWIFISYILYKRLTGFCVVVQEEGSKEPDRELIDDYEYFKMGSSQLKCSVFTKLGFEPL